MKTIEQKTSILVDCEQEVNIAEEEQPPSPWGEVTKQEWEDWHWQLAHRIQTVDQLRQVISLSDEEQEVLSHSLNALRMAITPYYASLMDPDDPHCPIRLRAIPTMSETHLAHEDMDDPLHEDVDSPVKGLTHRYPDRVLMLLSDQCAMYCRHCTRRRLAGEKDQARTTDEYDAMIDYVREHPGIRDVILSGGDPLTMSTQRLESVISRLREIPHVEIIRIGTATPAVMPMRITDELVAMLKRYQPIWINTHFNHPKELTPEAAEALARLVDGGIVVGNQNVLLKGVNDCPYILKELFQHLVKLRVRPYKMYQCDLSQGIGHFRTSIAKGIGIMEHLIGHTSGIAIPEYVVDLPGGGGKVPVNPRYMISQGERVVLFRNYAGKIYKYVEPEDTTPSRCPENCTICHDRKMRGLDQEQIGLARLLDTDEIML
ncbi:MAG: lysine 2,3-aminomutase [Anaerolineae bacterium]|jgi:lysine 2,3-aminomutase|nr:lysine 2,3-aminomutase [Anaerolineae bacterium]